LLGDVIGFIAVLMDKKIDLAWIAQPGFKGFRIGQFQIQGFGAVVE
jgi:hypothetical protein